MKSKSSKKNLCKAEKTSKQLKVITVIALACSTSNPDNQSQDFLKALLKLGAQVEIRFLQTTMKAMLALKKVEILKEAQKSKI